MAHFGKDIMPSQKGSYFHHRLNRNGTYDSICPGCYITVATTSQEGDLVLHEKTHECDPLMASQISQYAQRVFDKMEVFAARTSRPTVNGLRERSTSSWPEAPVSKVR